MAFILNFVDWAKIWISIYYNDFILNFVDQPKS